MYLANIFNVCVGSRMRKPYMIIMITDHTRQTYLEQNMETYILYIWANYNNSLTWIKAIWGWFPLLTMISSELVVSSL